MLTEMMARIAYRTSNPHYSYRRGILLVPISAGSLDSWFCKRQVFFIVSTGRTATKWLAELLDCIPNAYVEHEPVPVETWAHREAVCDSDAADRYIRDLRRKEIRLRVGRSLPAGGTYGEVNGILRRHIEPIQTWIPHAKLVHLVRDGRDLVRSLISRGTYAGNHPVYRDFRPPAVDEYSTRWDELPEFEKACWMWSWENKHMREKLIHTARFEDILSSYDLFAKQILAPLDLEMDEHVWQASIKRPRNVTGEHLLGLWGTWTSEQQQTFISICGEEMAAYGYSTRGSQ